MMINSEELILQLKGCVRLSNVLLDELIDDKNAAYVKGKIFAYESVLDAITNMSSASVITNGDWIRSMDDDELLEFLDNTEEFNVDWRGDDSCENCMNLNKCNDCKQCIKEWLAREYKVETVRQKTFKDDFLEKFPNARLNNDGSPRICAEDVYGLIHCDFPSCEECWNTPYKEV